MASYFMVFIIILRHHKQKIVYGKNEFKCTIGNENLFFEYESRIFFFKKNQTLILRTAKNYFIIIKQNKEVCWPKVNNCKYLL